MKNVCYTESRYQNQLFGEKYFPPHGGGFKKGKEKEGQRVKG
jgi:hypothetical protein